ncbi:hypothetical protein RJG79_01980 [Mycoplasmatota bacterium WC44]
MKKIDNILKKMNQNAKSVIYKIGPLVNNLDNQFGRGIEKVKDNEILDGVIKGVNTTAVFLEDKLHKGIEKIITKVIK